MDFFRQLFNKTVFDNPRHVSTESNESLKPSVVKEEILKEINADDNKIDSNTDRNFDQNNISNSNDIENKTLSELREFETILHKYNINMNQNCHDFNEIDTIIKHVTENELSDSRINCIYNVESEHNYVVPYTPFACHYEKLANQNNFQNSFETTNVIETFHVDSATDSSESIMETEEPARYNAFGVLEIGKSDTVIVNEEPDLQIDCGMASDSRPDVQTLARTIHVVSNSESIDTAVTYNVVDVQNNSNVIGKTDAVIDNEDNLFGSFLVKDIFEIPNNVSINNNSANIQNIVEITPYKERFDIKKDSDVISISSDEYLETESQDIQMDDDISDKEDGYNSSDFEFITEEQAKRCDLFRNINKSAQYFDNFNKPVETVNISSEYNENAIIYDYFETLTPSQDRKVPSDEEYYNMYQENSVQRHSVQMENKSVCPILTMQVEFGAVEMITNQDNGLLEDALDSAKAIRSMYPNENRNRRRSQSNIKLRSNGQIVKQF